MIRLFYYKIYFTNILFLGWEIALFGLLLPWNKSLIPTLIRCCKIYQRFSILFFFESLFRKVRSFLDESILVSNALKGKYFLFSFACLVKPKSCVFFSGCRCLSLSLSQTHSHTHTHTHTHSNTTTFTRTHIHTCARTHTLAYTHTRSQTHTQVGTAALLMRGAD